MALVPTFSIPPSFMGVANTSPDAAYCIAGVPLDIATSHRPGARFGPAAIRAISRMLVDGANPLNWRRPGNLDLADVGNFEIALGDTLESLRRIEAQAVRYRHLIALGGDHAIALPLLRAVARKHGPVGLVHFDAHVDTWPETFGQIYGHGSCFYHAIEEGLVDPRRMIQVGIRSPLDREIHDWTVAKGVRIVSAQEALRLTPEALAELIVSVAGVGKTYLSFDIDAIDPSQAPGTGTPEVGGLETWRVSAVLSRLGAVNWVGMDMVEVSPIYDVSEITALAAATIVWQYLSLMPGAE